MLNSFDLSSHFKINYKSAIHGTSVVATSRIEPKHPIYKPDDFLLFSSPSYQTVQIGEQDHILERVFASINHSCCPNTYIDGKKLILIAERNIEAGEELTFFYPATEWRMIRPFKCECGCRNCIKNVLGAYNIPPNILARYKLNEHIKKLLFVHQGITIE